MYSLHSLLKMPLPPIDSLPMTSLTSAPSKYGKLLALIPSSVCVYVCACVTVSVFNCYSECACLFTVCVCVCVCVCVFNCYSVCVCACLFNVCVCVCVLWYVCGVVCWLIHAIMLRTFHHFSLQEQLRNLYIMLKFVTLKSFPRCFL